MTVFVIILLYSRQAPVFQYVIVILVAIFIIAFSSFIIYSDLKGIERDKKKKKSYLSASGALEPSLSEYSSEYLKTITSSSSS